MAKLSKYIFPFFIVSFLCNSLSAQEICKKEAIYKKTATASTWENLRNNQGSLKFETSRIIKKGLSELNNDKLYIKSIPKEFLLNSNDHDYCNQKLSETGSAPLRFYPTAFSSVDELNSWVGDFSQGSGEEGKKLYKSCDKSCSPQYEYIISKEKEKIKLEALVTCGLPRNKDNNEYLLIASCGQYNSK